jgi:hypothetical protein
MSYVDSILRPWLGSALCSVAVVDGEHDDDERLSSGQQPMSVNSILAEIEHFTNIAGPIRAFLVV